jgi:ferritin-like metal-binding protein YciE
MSAHPLLDLAIRDMQQLLADEPQLQKTFAALRPRVQAGPLKTLCRDGVSYTRRRIQRLREALRILGAPAQPRPTKGLRGLLQDARAASQSPLPQRDALVLARIERISHYGLAAYTTIDRYLSKVRAPDVQTPQARRLLAASLHEKREAISDMSRMARKTILTQTRFGARPSR